MSNNERFDNETWKHEHETCEGCRYYREHMGERQVDQVCLHREMKDEKGWPDMQDQCEAFVLSLLCRQVRAAEEQVAWQERMEDVVSVLGLRQLSRLVRTALDTYMRRRP